MIVASQFADDTTVYAATAEGLRFTMNAVTTEFCVASGARLNTLKTRTLCAGGALQPPAPIQGGGGWESMNLVILQGNETLRSLGAVYGSNLPPASHFDTVLEKIQSRMMRWQSRHPSVMARVLIANSLLSSCLWFFAYFMVPSEQQQLHSFDAMVWGMLWGKSRGDVGSKGVVSRHRVAQPQSVGGLKVIIPSVMIRRAIRVNMVNRALSDRGRWWTPLFHYWCEKASGGLFRDADVLLSSKRAVTLTATRIKSEFWKAAVRDWAQLEYHLPSHNAPTAPHREHAGSYAALADITPQRLWGAPPPTAQVLSKSNMIYLSDFWNYSSLRWCEEETLADSTAAATALLPTTRRRVMGQIAQLQRKAFRSTPHVVELECDRQDRQELLKEGEV